MPKLDKKHHMIGYDIIINKESRDLVHHMDIYDCNVDLFDEKTLYNGTECGPVKIKDSPRQKCSSLVVAWVKICSIFCKLIFIIQSFIFFLGCWWQFKIQIPKQYGASVCANK